MLIDYFISNTNLNRNYTSITYILICGMAVVYLNKDKTAGGGRDY